MELAFTVLTRGHMVKGRYQKWERNVFIKYYQIFETRRRQHKNLRYYEYIQYKITVRKEDLTKELRAAG
jgi:hypothetical protein